MPEKKEAGREREQETGKPFVQASPVVLSVAVSQTIRRVVRPDQPQHFHCSQVYFAPLQLSIKLPRRLPS